MRLLAFLFLLVLISGCNNEPENDDINKTFFPIEGNIKAELKTLDSLPIAILHYRTADGKSDTGIISKEAFREVAAQLYQPDISSSEWKKYYHESVFMDNTINTVTMSYTTSDPKPVVRKIEIMLHPETDQVRSIYVEKHEGNTVKKMIWTPRRNLQIITMVDGETTNVKTEKYTWE